MRILHTCEFYDPSKGGAQEVVKRISELLVEAGHEVSVATTSDVRRGQNRINGVNVVGFDISGNAVRGFNGNTRSYQDFLTANRFDVMMNYAAQQWATDLALPVLERMHGARLLAPCGFSGLLCESYAEYFASLPRYLAQYDRLILHSGTYRDAAFAVKHGLQSKMTVIPNGASEREFSSDGGRAFRAQYRIAADEPMLLLVGSHTGWKGHRQAIRVLAGLETRRAALFVIGNALGNQGCLLDDKWEATWTRLKSLGRKRVFLLDLPRPEVVSAFLAADLFVFPSNIECSPIVLFEAMASRTPFVSSDVGNAREIAGWSHSGVVLDAEQHPSGPAGYVISRDQDFIRAVDSLLKDKPRREAMAEQGYQAFKAGFSWEGIAKRYESAYREAMA